MLNKNGFISSILSVGSGGHLKLIRHYFDHFQLKDLDPNYWLHKQGLLDKNQLPTHSFRDDALPLWRVINNLVRKIVFLHYKNDVSVKSDKECQIWFTDSRNKGFDFGADSDYENEEDIWDGLDFGSETGSKAMRNTSPLSIIHEGIEKTNRDKMGIFGSLQNML